MDEVHAQIKRRRRLAVAAASLFTISSCGVALHRHFRPHASSTELQPNPNLHIQNLQSRNNHRNQDGHNHNRKLMIQLSCIDFWHVSIAPRETHTCTNSGHYPPEWAHTGLLDYMFHASADDCCEEMLKPWKGFANAEYDGNAYGGGVPTCSIVDACAVSTTNSTAHDHDGCDGKSFMECVQDIECRFDESAIACVVLETMLNNDHGSDDNATSNTTDMSNNQCSGKPKGQCRRDSQCKFDAASDGCIMRYESMNSDADETTTTTPSNSSCSGKPKRTCIRSKCQYDTPTDTCSDVTPSSSSSPTPVESSDAANNDNNNNDNCRGNKYHPTSVLIRKCSNNEMFPALWNQPSMRETYLFTTADECCAAFYNDGSCEVDNICSSSTTTTSDNNNEPVVNTICSDKSRKECIQENQCGWDRLSKSCMGKSGRDTAQGEAPTVPTNSPTTHCNVWHESRESLFTCTNDGNYPELWNDPSKQKLYLFPSSSECCRTRFNGRPCTIFDSCIAPMTTSPTTRMPSEIPTPQPVTQQPVLFAHDGSKVDPTCYNKEWHVSREPGSQDKCTNDKRYPEAWLHPAIKPYYMFNTTEACCQSNFGTFDCILYDVCLEGTNPPTISPTTLQPTPNPWPTYSPSSTPTLPLHATADSTCNARWHVSNEENRGSTCTNDDNFPEEWKLPEKRDYFLFGSATKCCEALFPKGRCDLVNICPDGVPTAMPTTPVPTTSKPTKRPPTRKPTSRPTRNEPWYVDRQIGKCVQDCTGANPCGGKMSQWADAFKSARACCDSMPWVEFGACLATPSPTVPPPPPSPAPKTDKPTSRPTLAPITSKPTNAPTHVPTIDCSAYKWHMSIRSGELQTCTNDEEYPEQWLQNAQMFFHSTSDECCQLKYGGNCSVRDWCAGINKVKVDDAAAAAIAEAAAAVIAAEAAQAAALAAAAAAEAAAAAAAAAVEENEANQSFVKFDGGMDDFEGDGTIPWILGSPPEWKIDDTMAFSRTHSITNIQSDEVNAIRTLTTKIDLSASATLTCQVYIDVGMPFDMFGFHVNGAKRDVFYKPEDDWITITTGIAPGSNTIQFVVTNGDMFPDFGRGGQEAIYGTGHVWVDQCNIR